VQFSVIIPTCNRPQFLSQAIRSVATQKDVELEILVVNDGEPLPHAHGDPRMRILDNANKGTVAARNLGISHARGKLIAFLDDDDWWMDENFLSKAWALHQSGANFIFADGVLVFDDGRPDLPFAFDADASSLRVDNSILISTVCYTSALHWRLGVFNEALPYYCDWDWHLRVAKSGEWLVRLPEKVAAIRVHSSNMSNSDQRIARQQNLEMLQALHTLAPLTLKNHLSLALEKL
jgi:glycosyltransferase involved in cell wall biosynthesis